MYVDTSHIKKPAPLVTQEEEPTFAANEYAIVGKLHCMKNPKSAKELLEEFNNVKAKAKDDDFHNLNFYYLHFCRNTGTDPLDYLGNVSNRSKVHERKIYVAAMLRMYRPQLFTHDINVGNGIGEHLCVTLRYDKGAMSRIVDEVVSWYNMDFDGFRGVVDDVVASMVSLRDGYESDLFKSVA